MAEKNGSEKHGYVQLWDHHEDRIRDLERDRIEVAKELSEQTATLRGIKEDIQDLASYNRDAARTMAEVLQNVRTHIAIDEQRFKSLENPKTSKIQEIWTNWWAKILFGAISTGGGALLAYLAK